MDINIWEDHGRVKTSCDYSSSGDTWIGFCKFCRNDCGLAGKSQEQIKSLGNI